MPLTGTPQPELFDGDRTLPVTSMGLGIHPRVVMEIVGHSAIEMTMNVYGHVNLDTQRAALDHLDEQLSG